MTGKQKQHRTLRCYDGETIAVSNSMRGPIYIVNNTTERRTVIYWSLPLWLLLALSNWPFPSLSFSVMVVINVKRNK